MSDIIVDLTDRFMSAEEELMQTLGWDSIVNLWRVWEAIGELEYKHRIIHKESRVVHLAKRVVLDRPKYKPMCNLTVYPRWQRSKLELGYGDEEITCRRCLQKTEAQR